MSHARRIPIQWAHETAQLCAGVISSIRIVRLTYVEITSVCLGSPAHCSRRVWPATHPELRLARTHPVPFSFLPSVSQATRLGKVINECRRRTNNETLARRAKLLVRKWREMMQVGSAAPPPISATVSSNPPTPALSPVAPPHHNGTNVRSPNVARLGAADRLPRAASVSPALTATSSRHGGANVINNSSSSNNSNNSYNSFSSSGKSSGYIGAATLVSPSSMARSPPKVESVPKTHVANMRRRKNLSAASPEPPTKAAKVNGAMFASHHSATLSPPAPAQHYHNIQLLRHHQDTDRLLSPPSTFGSAAYNAIAERLAEDAFSATVTETAPPDESLERLADCEQLAGRRAPAATTVPEPEPDPPPEPSTSSSSKRGRKKAKKKNRGDGDVVREKLKALSKTGRVKTTEELVAELKSLNEDRLAGATEAPDQLADNCAAGPSKPPSLSNSYVVSDSGPHHRLEGAGDCAGAVSRPPIEQLDAEARVEREIADILARLPPLDVAQIRWDETPPSSPPPSPQPPTDEEVERYLHGRWDGLNGCVTHSIAQVAHKSPAVAQTAPSVAQTAPSVAQTAPDDAQPAPADEFREWHEMVARRTTNDDLIHILPYSIVD